MWFRGARDFSMGQLYDTIFWLKWPPPWWVWVLAVLIVALAAGMVLLR
ncbi:MAG: hypothetical protein AB7O46_02560 [Xanthobacteraceae bacterium]